MSEEKKEKDVLNGEAPAEATGQDGAAAQAPTAEQIAEIQKKAAERDDFLDKLQRTRADYLNYQKRAKKDREQAAEFAVQDLIVQLAPLITDLERAVQSGEQSRDLTAFFEGVKILSGQFHKILSDNGVARIETTGKRFDPAYHEAVMQQETTEHPEHTIIAELRSGYTMNGRTIVPARVSVAKAPKTTEPPEEDAESIKEGEDEGADV